MNESANRTAGLEPADGSGEVDHGKRLRQHVSSAWLAIEDAKRVLRHSSRWEAQEAVRYLLEAQEELEALATREGERGGEAVHGEDQEAPQVG